MSERISLITQEGALRSYFPVSKIMRDRERDISWTHTLQPTTLSSIYTVKLHYSEKKKIAEVFVLSPEQLPKAKGKVLLPHVYSTPKQRLCLYYPLWREWDSSMLYVHTLIPWASEWLYHYEIWVATGTWNGGGIDHETTAENE